MSRLGVGTVRRISPGALPPAAGVRPPIGLRALAPELWHRQPLLAHGFTFPLHASWHTHVLAPRRDRRRRSTSVWRMGRSERHICSEPYGPRLTRGRLAPVDKYESLRLRILQG